MKNYQTILDSLERDKIQLDSVIKRNKQVNLTIDKIRNQNGSKSRRLQVESKTNSRNIQGLIISRNDIEHLNRSENNNYHPYSNSELTKRENIGISNRSFIYASKNNSQLFSQRHVIEEVSEKSVERLQVFNQSMKDQISQIIETLEGKIQRAKHRKAQEIADDPTFMVMKGMNIFQYFISYRA